MYVRGRGRGGKDGKAVGARDWSLLQLMALLGRWPGNKDMESRRMGKETCLCAGCHAAAETRVQEQGGHK
jgi:hypothetical protein